MSAGRPAWTWHNELEMLRAEVAQLKQATKFSHGLLEVLGIEEVRAFLDANQLAHVVQFTFRPRLDSVRSWRVADAFELVAKEVVA
mgnify:CR=1 FL=1